MADNVTFKEQYSKCKTWQEKAILIALYHSIMVAKYPTWNVQDTASHFHKSIGLVSENIKLARAIDEGNKKVIGAATREDGLKMLEKRRYMSERKEITLDIDVDEIED